MKLNERLRELRKERKLTQKELARVLDIPYRTLINWELDKRMPTYENMVKLQDFFDVSGAYLRGETNQRTPMEKWEDPELMETMDQSIDFMMKNIAKLLNNQPERTKSEYFRFFVEFQRILKYDPEIQDCIIDVLVNALSACSRAVDTSWEIKNSLTSECDPKYTYIAEKEIQNITEDINTIVSFIDFE